MDVQTRFAMLRAAEGGHYDALRRTPGMFDADLGAYALTVAQAADWRDRAMAAIVLGWRNETDLYRSVDADLDAVRPGLAAARVTGLAGVADRYRALAAETYGRRITPYALEAVTKFSGVAPAWRTAAALAMIEGAADPAGLDPVAWLLLTTEDAELRDRAALTLARLPGAESRVPALKARAAALAAAVALAESELP